MNLDRRQCDLSVSHSETLQRIATYLASFANLHISDIDSLVSKGRHRVLEAGQAFCRLGQHRHEVGFIQSGIVRYFALSADGEDATKDFGLNGSFTLSFGSAALAQPAQVAIEAVVRTELLVWPYQVFLDLYESDIEWQKAGRRIAELLYIRKEQRELSFLQQDAETRYRILRAQFGIEVDAIPQYFLASYLGIRPQSLSRLKRRMASEPR